MKRFLSVAFSLICAGTIFADYLDTTYSEVNIAGTVLDKTGQPLLGAHVTIAKAPYLAALSDENGKFTLAGQKMDTATIGVRVPGLFRNGNAAGISLQGDRLFIASSLGNTVTIGLYAANGCRVQKVTIDKLGSADGTVSFPVTTKGLYVLNVTAGKHHAAFKRLFSAGQKISVLQGALGTESRTITATAEPVSDTLIAVVNGYMPVYIPIAAYSLSGTEVKFETNVDSWQPIAGSLEYSSNLVKIKANGFTFGMGQPVVVKDDPSKWSRELPVHRVTFTYDFWMDTTEVSQALYDSLMKNVPRYTTPTGWIAKYGVGPNIAAHHSGPGDAMLFCNERSKAEGLDTVYSYDSIVGTPGGMCTLSGFTTDCSKNGYRLPTEAEWEYACRGGTATDYYWNKMYRPYPATAADTAEFDSYVLWYHNCGSKPTDGNEYALKQGVASKKPNNYGLYDMIGGCVEYIHFLGLNYPADMQTDPKPTTPADTILSYRGGNFSNDPVYLRSSSRLYKWGDYFYCFLGFRTVKEVR